MLCCIKKKKKKRGERIIYFTELALRIKWWNVCKVSVHAQQLFSIVILVSSDGRTLLWCHLFTQPHIFSAKLTRCFCSTQLHAGVTRHHLASAATPVSAFFPEVHSPFWHAPNWECKGSWLPTPCGNSWQLKVFEAWGNWWIEAPFLILWGDSSDLRDGFSLESPGEIESQFSTTVSNLTTHPCSAFSSSQTLSRWFTLLPWDHCSKWTIACKSLNGALISRRFVGTGMGTEWEWKSGNERFPD